MPEIICIEAGKDRYGAHVLIDDFRSAMPSIEIAHMFAAAPAMMSALEMVSTLDRPLTAGEKRQVDTALTIAYGGGRVDVAAETVEQKTPKLSRLMSDIVKELAGPESFVFFRPEDRKYAVGNPADSHSAIGITRFSVNTVTALFARGLVGRAQMIPVTSRAEWFRRRRDEGHTSNLFCPGTVIVPIRTK